MNSNDPTRDRIDAAERMLHHARQQHIQGIAEDTAEFLSAARRNIDRAVASIERTAPVVQMQIKEAKHAR